MSVSPATLIASLVVAVACMTALLLPAETINNLKNNLPQHPSFLYEQYKGAFSSGGSLGDECLSRSRKRICLNTVMHDEGNVIVQWLGALPKLDGYLVCDAGSRDGTPEIVEAYFKRAGIPGEVYPIQAGGDTKTSQRACTDATQRAKTLENKCDYWLFLTTKQILISADGIELSCSGLKDSSYWIEEHINGTGYASRQLITNQAIVEQPAAGPMSVRFDSGAINVEEDVLQHGFVITQHSYVDHPGARVGNLKKILSLLEEASKRHPDDPSLEYHIANAYKGLDESLKAVPHWLKTIQYGNGSEQAYVAALEVAAFLDHSMSTKADISKVLTDIQTWIPEITAHQNLTWENVVSAYKAAADVLPYRKEAMYHVAKLYRTQLQDTKTCYKFAVEASSRGPHTKDTLNSDEDIIQIHIDDELCVCAYYAQKFQEGLDACRRLETRLAKSKNGTWQRNMLDRTRGNSGWHRKGLGIKEERKEPEYDNPHDLPFLPVKNKGRIAASFTTAHRPGFFRRTYHSFKQRCMDCDLIETWVAVDDFSSEEHLRIMQTTAPSVKWLPKNETARGHVASIQTILNYVKDYDYLVYMEDDWYFIQDEYFISRALDILDADPKIGQVLFNDNYRELDVDTEVVRLAPSNRHVTPRGQNYRVHNYVGAVGSPEWNAAHAKVPGMNSHYHWPHFSLRPGIWRLSVIREIGDIVDQKEFEYEYAFRYIAKGYKSAFLPGFYAIHLAPLARTKAAFDSADDINHMYEKHGFLDLDIQTASSAYILANTER